MSSFRSTFAYTNITHLEAGRIVAKSEGDSDWGAVLRREIFEPLGMTESSVTAEAIDVMELATGALKLSPWDGEIFTAALVPNGPLAAVAENLGPQPLYFAQFQMDATGALNVVRLTTSDGQTYEFRRE